MGKASRDKGCRGEREIVRLHKAMKIPAERVPLSGAMNYQHNAEDVDIYPFGEDEGALVCQVKRQATDAGWKTILGQLGEADALFFRTDRSEWHVMVPMRVWRRLVMYVAGGWGAP